MKHFKTPHNVKKKLMHKIFFDIGLFVIYLYTIQKKMILFVDMHLRIDIIVLEQGTTPLEIGREPLTLEDQGMIR